MKKLLALSVTLVALASFRPGGYNVGDKAMDFKLKNVDNKMVSLSDYTDTKGVIVIFTCNHCPYAKAYEDRIIALDNKYRPLGYPVIAINPNDPVAVPEDNFAAMQERAKAKHYGFPYLVDATQDVARTYGAAHTPTVYVLQKSGTDYIVKYIGAIDDNTFNPSAVKQKYVEDAVDELLAGKRVGTDFTKAIGCGIKWKS